jgi:hypothetical protein
MPRARFFHLEPHTAGSSKSSEKVTASYWLENFAGTHCSAAKALVYYSTIAMFSLLLCSG